MKLSQLGKQYLSTAQQLKERVEQLKQQQSKQAPPAELRQIESRIHLLYEEYLHLNRIGCQLIFYYGKRGQ